MTGTRIFSWGFLLLSPLIGLILSPMAGSAPNPVRNREAAVAKNSELKMAVEWSFGGKAQRGWHLYEPLIVQCIRFDGRAEGEAFAVALAQWQKSMNLSAHGILDQVTWMKMVERWQVRRSQDRTIPTAEKLVTVSAAEFYDPERPAELRQVERATYTAYKRMVAVAA